MVNTFEDLIGLHCNVWKNEDEPWTKENSVRCKIIDIAPSVDFETWPCRLDIKVYLEPIGEHGLDDFEVEDLKIYGVDTDSINFME